MNRISRYVLRELSLTLLLTLSAMTLLIVMVGVVAEAMKQGLGPGPIARLIPYVVPNALQFAIPGSALFAACSVFGRLSADNEITAIKSVGVPPLAVIQPVLAAAFLISLVSVWINDLAASWGTRGVQRVVMHSVEEIAYGMLRTNRSYATNHVSIIVQRVEGRKLIQPTFTFQVGSSSSPVTLMAEEGELRLNPERATLSIVLVNTVIEYGRQLQGSLPQVYEHEIPLDFALKKGGAGVASPAQLALRDIPRDAQLTRKRIREHEQTLAAETAFHLTLGEFDQLRDAQWKEQQTSLASNEQRLQRLRVEPWRRWANAFSSFCFVLVGAPLAMRLRNADLWTTFGVCFLPTLILYYPLLMMSIDRAKSGAWPPFSVWLGNTVFLVIGGWLLRKVQRS